MVSDVVYVTRKKMMSLGQYHVDKEKLGFGSLCFWYLSIPLLLQILKMSLLDIGKTGTTISYERYYHYRQSKQK